VPRRPDLHTILLIGSGPIVIGQGGEFAHAGVQALQALREEGLAVVVVNSNPATVMTDPDRAHRTYVEPLTAEYLARVIAREQPQAVLPTFGGQTALNLAVTLAEDGTLDRYGVELLGAKRPAITMAEDRGLFKRAMARLGLEVPRSGLARSVEAARAIVEAIGYPAVIRPSFTLGGTGASIVHDARGLDDAIRWGLATSPAGAALVEQSLIGWKEFELELVRDRADDVVVVCLIENVDPMGVHTGDSITVAPALTATGEEATRMRDAAIAIIREIGVEGGASIRFAVNPADGRLRVIEMNPRVSRSSAFASKATGFPIARIAAKLAVGYTLDEMRTEVTRRTPARVEPAVDHCAVKFPRWAFERFPDTDQTLTTQMKSVGAVMAMGRTFPEALQKAIRSLEQGRCGLTLGRAVEEEELRRLLRVPNADRLFAVGDAYRAGFTTAEIHALTRIDPWFLEQMGEIVAFEAEIRRTALTDRGVLRRAKRLGFADRRIADLTGATELAVRARRLAAGIRATLATVPPSSYATYEAAGEAAATDRPKVLVLGSGPNRIGQGIEFDDCGVHAAAALRELGVEAVAVNSNPDTVLTGGDGPDRLYVEPVTLEDVLNVVDRERPLGVIVQFGGQTPLALAAPLQQAGVTVLGTSPDAIARAEDRQRLSALLAELGLPQVPGGTARSGEEAARIAARIGYPVVVRPSSVMGGRAMRIARDEEALVAVVGDAARASPEHPVRIDKFLEDAIELDMDAVSDGERVVIGGVMEHIEKAGVHSGDAACSLPPYSLADDEVRPLREQTKALARALGVIGLVNVQFAIRGEVVHVLAVNPRASRTVPFVSKTMGVPVAALATRVMLGHTLEPWLALEQREPAYVAVKEAVLPFAKFRGVDTVLGPEMRSTGEVMGIDSDLRSAYLKSQLALGLRLPTSGAVLICTLMGGQRLVLTLASRLVDMGFPVVAPPEAARKLERYGIDVRTFRMAPLRNGMAGLVDAGVGLVIDIAGAGRGRDASRWLREAAVRAGVPYCTTMDGAHMLLAAIETLLKHQPAVLSLQEYHATLTSPPAPRLDG
jgi:carbamoyl-phosphate synthase large subunit